MVRIELGHRLYVTVGHTYNIRTSFETNMGGRHTYAYIGVVDGVMGENLILARGIVAYSKLACWGGDETGISLFQDAKVQLKDIESILKIK